MHQDIVDYLNGGSRDFDSGFALFCKYTRNRNLVNWIGRKKDMPKLLYELGKLAGFDGSARVSPPKLPPLPPASPPAPDISDAASDIQAPVVRTYDERRTNRRDLPLHLQKVYDDIADLYKLRRAWHEKMKFARTDLDRARCRERLLDTHSQITRGWKKIDDWILGKDRQIQESDFKESSCRAYISKLLRKESLSPEQRERLKIRVEAMIKHGCAFSETTILLLKKWGVWLK